MHCSAWADRRPEKGPKGGGAALFGLAAGSFVNLQIALIDAVKTAGIVLFSFVLCLPTLYVSATISGCRIGFVRVALVGLSALACVGCILAALAPVLWLFAAVLGAKNFKGAVKAHAVEHDYGLYAWFLIFLVVVLQTVTLVRPMLTPDSAVTFAPHQDKCLFLTHFHKALKADCNRSIMMP